MSAAQLKEKWKLAVAKYLLMMALLGFVIYTFWQKAERDVPFETVAEAVLTACDTERMAEGDAHALKRYYGLEMADYDGVLFYYASYGMEAQELLLLRLRDGADEELVERAVMNRLKSRERDFAGYAPEASALIERAEVVTKGNYVLLCVSEHAKEVERAFREALR